MEFLSIFLSIGLTSAFLQVFVEKLANYCLKKIGKTSDLDNDLQKLGRTLLKIQSLIDDVENKHSISNACRILIEDFRSVVLDADDLLDQIVADVRNSSKLVKKMLQRVRDLAAEVEVYFISEISKPRPRQALAIPHGSSLVDEFSVAGRNDEKKKLINWLLAENTTPESHQHVSVSSIVGMGGTGKTTLAQLVYNDPGVVETFALRMWVCVSLDYDLVKITKSILESATSVSESAASILESAASILESATSIPECATSILESATKKAKKVSELSDLDSILNQLKTVIKEKKFLLVLDDMWNENPVDWDALKLFFRFAESGSKVVVTTRSKIVSSIVTTTPSHTHILNALPIKDCQEIIEKILSPSIAEPGNLKKMAEKCKGLPLAAKVIALHFKSQGEWDSLLEFDFWNLAEDKNYIYPVLKLSYDHLPAYLKRCFAYCSIFPLGHEFQVDDLIQLWAAEGFIQAQGTRRIEDIGRDYFHELVASSFFEVSENAVGERVYKMHDFIHYLARLVSTNLCFRSEENMNMFWPISRNVRHWSLPHQNVRKETWEEFQRYDKLRTFILLSKSPSNLSEVPIKFFEKMLCLRVLYLRDSAISSLSDDFAKLIHLRYLNLSRNAFKKLPESIASIHGLETLKLNDCSELLELPENFNKLIKLRHFYFERCPKITSMPKEVGRLTSLQTVDVFIAGKATGYRIEELKNMTSLGAVGIKQLENVTNQQDALVAKLENKQYLEKLELLWTRGSRDPGVEKQVLGGLKPHDGLKNLKVTGYCGSEFPEWIGGPASSVCKLVTLCIHSCSKLVTLPSFDRLTLLKVLEITGCPMLKSLPAGELPTSLESITISDSKMLEDWCKRSTGADRIRRIPTIMIDHQIIRSP